MLMSFFYKLISLNDQSELEDLIFLYISVNLLIHDKLVDSTEGQSLVGCTADGHGDEGNVGEWRLFRSMRVVQKGYGQSPDVVVQSQEAIDALVVEGR